MAKSKQHADVSGSGVQAQGGNISGKGPSSPPRRNPGNFQDKSGQGDNQSTFRGKGKT